MDQISIANLITQLLTFKISVFQVVMDNNVYKVLSVEKKSLKVVNNTITIGL